MGKQTFFAIRLSRPPKPYQLEAAQRNIAKAEENGDWEYLAGAAVMLRDVSGKHEKQYPDSADRLAALSRLALDAAVSLNPELEPHEPETTHAEPAPIPPAIS